LDIFSLDRVVVPVHLGNHWCLAVINIEEKRFEYYDSLGAGNENCLERLKRYVQDEHKEKKKSKIDISDWQDYTPNDIPHQQNGYDCGVFMCKYAQCISRGVDFDFSQADMAFFRKKMVLEILDVSLSDESLS